MVNNGYKTTLLTISGAVILLLVSMIAYGGQRMINQIDDIERRLTEHEGKTAHSSIDRRVGRLEHKVVVMDSTLYRLQTRRDAEWLYQIKVNEVVMDANGVPLGARPPLPRHLRNGP